jgi:hypothetical protein
VKRSESIVEDFDSISRYLDRIENERVQKLQAPAVGMKEEKSEDRANISQLWISGKI